MTPGGGFCIDFTIVISDGLSVSNAERAASNAGCASAKSARHSSLNALEASAF
ncbi:unnamed protein product [Schistosoma mattheei]|uniref:Uncharacterized protein n=1 Tax=Schistosoma mattheei TaxID=31246 RepID=A0A3P7YUA9_9TREM|nr:unnamed protein product [Schistosoma mattheei]